MRYDSSLLNPQSSILIPHSSSLIPHSLTPSLPHSLPMQLLFSLLTSLALVALSAHSALASGAGPASAPADVHAVAPVSSPNPNSVARRTLHPISITEAAMFVTKTRAKTRIQMFAEDLVLFQGLEPDEQDRLRPDDLRQGLEDHKAFLLEKFTLRDASGERVPGQVTDLKPFEIPADGIPSADMMKHTAVYEIEHTFAAPPEFLTIQQDLADENFIIPSEMSIQVKQAGSALNFSERLLPGTSTTVRFDWENALSEDASDQDWERWFEKQREKTLGITSYSSVYSFIYIEPGEVRHEILIPLATLATIIRIQHRDPAFVDIDEQDAIRESIRTWLTPAAPATVNGTRIDPRFTRIDFYSLNLSDFATQAAAQKVSMASGRVGIILSYRPTDDFVRDVALPWTLFYSGLTKIPAVVVTWPGPMDRFEFSRFNKPEDNTLRWNCPEESLPKPITATPASVPPAPSLSIPHRLLIPLALAAFAAALLFRRNTKLRWIIPAVFIATAAFNWSAKPLVLPHPWKQPAELAPAESTRIFRELHTGMYQALDFGSETRIYDALAATVDGPLLEQLYLQLLESLRVREQSGAVARIKSISYTEDKPQPRTQSAATPAWSAFAVHAVWQVAGTVEHWGHVHERENQFDAVFTIQPIDGFWKITRMDILGQQQKSARTTLRRF